MKEKLKRKCKFSIQNNPGVRGTECIYISSTHRKSSREDAENELTSIWES